MTDQDAFDEWFAKRDVWPRITYDEVWHAALAWLRSQGEPVARLLHWKGPSHYPVPHKGIAARTFEEFGVEEAEKPDGYWQNGEPLFLVPQPAIPDGWKLVPMEPTEEMLLSAFCEAGGSYENKEGIYRAMLAAAPEPNK